MAVTPEFLAPAVKREKNSNGNKGGIHHRQLSFFDQSSSKSASGTLASAGPADDNEPIQILLKGDSGAGKSNLILRFTDDLYTELFISTIGVDFKEKIIESNQSHVKLQLWDTQGHERFQEISNRHPREFHAIVVACDVTEPGTLDHVTQCLKDISAAYPNAILTLAATKWDTPVAMRKVSEEEIRAFAQQHRLAVFFTSAKNNSNVDALFKHVADSMIQPRSQSAPRP